MTLIFLAWLDAVWQDGTIKLHRARGSHSAVRPTAQKQKVPFSFRIKILVGGKILLEKLKGKHSGRTKPKIAQKTADPWYRGEKNLLNYMLCTSNSAKRREPSGVNSNFKGLKQN